MFFDDFESTESVTSAPRTITEADVNAFADLTGDHVPLHTDEAYAATTAFGKRIAHGALVFSCSIGLATEMRLFDDSLLAFAGVDKLRFVAPVFLGDTIRVVKRVADRKALGSSQGIITFDTKVLNQRDQLVVAYQDRILVKRRPAAAETTALA